jgi:cellulose synthase (UDP-forming)
MMDGKSSQGDGVSGELSFATAAAPAHSPVEIRQGPVSIQKQPPRRRIKLAVTRVSVVLATFFSVRYFYWRFFYTMNPAAKIFFYVFLGAEVLSFIESLLFYFITWNPTHYSQPEPLPGRSVDVFIPTYNEPLHLLRETVLCAVNVSYPHRTYVLDDGHRDEVRELAREFNCGYISREERTHAKAGNLNNALAQTTGEFIVVLDADHVASPELIGDMIGFFVDEKIAGVQATQDFYNLDSFQHRVNWQTRAGWQQQELFFSVIQPGKDRHNATFYCGSPGMLRRSALEEIGGFPTVSITEDMHTSLRLQKKGLRVLYFNRTLARGLAPQTFTGFATQWYRWGHGAMQVWRAENPLFSKGLDLKQKICYFSSLYFYCMSYQKLFYVLTPIISLFFGVFALVAEPATYASYFLPYFLLNLTCSVLTQGGFRNFFLGEQFNLLKMHVMMKTLGGLFQRDSTFTVTPKAQASAARLSDLLLPVFLMGFLGASLFAAAIRLQHVPIFTYLFWALLVNVVWALVFLGMFGSVIVHSMQRKELRASYRFPSNLDLRIKVSYADSSGTRVSREQFARNLNRTGVSVTLENAISCGTPVDVELRLPGHTVLASGQIVRNQSYGSNGHSRISNGIRFDRIATTDQDEISKYLFLHIAPREGRLLHLTNSSQQEAETA